jgi:hypothetical protein
MSPKWFHRVRELFQDGFVAGSGIKSNAAQSVRKALKKLGKSRAFCLGHGLIGAQRNSDCCELDEREIVGREL